MEFDIENERLSVTVKSFGAELTSIFDKENNREVLWNGNPEFWPRHAPVLFPIVGRLKDNEYSFNGQNYHLTQHGFARDLEFEFQSKTEQEISFLLRTNAETKKVYPFDFKFILSYQLDENRLITKYEVFNSGMNEMYFSIGAHPAFQLDAPIDEYSLRFEKKETDLKRTKLASGLLDFREEFHLENGIELPLSEALFADDAIVFEKMNSEKLTLFHGENRILSMEYSGFPFYGIWKKQNAPFLCLEPWFGIADDADTSGELTEKKGICRLNAGQTKRLSFGIEVH